MKLIRIVGRPTFEIEIDFETLCLLMTLAEHHYDGVCKQAGEIGGFLYGWRNSAIAYEKRLPVVSATFRELDIMAKLMELPMSFFSAEERQRLAGLLVSIRRAIDTANKQDWSQLLI